MDDAHPTIAIKEIKKTNRQSEGEFLDTVETEVKTLEILRDRNHPHLIKAIAYYEMRNSHYLMFPWAGLGNLRNFWETEPPNIDETYLRWMFGQLSGLASAIAELHNYNKDSSYRHGDLKPENILCFESSGTPGEELDGPCCLVIADVDLTKNHNKATEARKTATRTMSGTIMYEPPETEILKDKPRSRRYDIWSLGCIYLEFIIWLLYGPHELKRFVRDLGDYGRFYEFDSSKKPKLHKVVEAWADHIKKDSRCPTNTALQQLLDIVMNQLLNTDIGATPTIKRVSTTVLHRAATIQETDDDIPRSPTVLVRAPTELPLSGSPTSSCEDGRISAEKLSKKLCELYDTAIGKEGTKIKWMQFDGKAQLGPDSRQYNSNLSESDAKHPISATLIKREVRQQLSELPTHEES